MTQDRLTNVRRVLKKRKLDCLLVSSVPNITYLTGFSNFSKDEREAFLLITKDEQFILTDGRYSEAVEEQVRGFQLIESSSKSPLMKLLLRIVRKEKVKRLGIEEDNLTAQECRKLSSCFDDVNHFSLTKLRAVKEPEEITAIEKACRIADQTFTFILKKIKGETTERRLAFEIELFIKQKGADVSFPPIVAFAKNSAIPHHQTSDQRLKTNDIVLLDFGVKINNYCSDMTRTVFFGKASARQKKMYRTILEAQKRAIEKLNILISQSLNILARDIDKVARTYIEFKGFPTIPHSLGHGIGLEVHELPRISPRSKDKLVPGMVFSIEPGIYEPGFGGIRIEDLVVLEKSGPRILTHTPKALIEL